jgi:hypothetical protein
MLPRVLQLASVVVGVIAAALFLTVRARPALFDSLTCAVGKRNQWLHLDLNGPEQSLRPDSQFRPLLFP